MSSLEDAFRTVLAARLPKGHAWAAWIDGTVHELAASVPVPQEYVADFVGAQGIDRDALRQRLCEWEAVEPHEVADGLLDDIEALVRPGEGVVLAPEDVTSVRQWYTAAKLNGCTRDHDDALATRLEAP